MISEEVVLAVEGRKVCVCVCVRDGGKEGRDGGKRMEEGRRRGKEGRKDKEGGVYVM